MSPVITASEPSIAMALEPDKGAVHVVGGGFPPIKRFPLLVEDGTQAYDQDGQPRWRENQPEFVAHILVTTPTRRQFGHTTSVQEDGRFDQLVDVDQVVEGAYAVKVTDHYDGTVLAEIEGELHLPTA